MIKSKNIIFYMLAACLAFVNIVFLIGCSSNEMSMTTQQCVNDIGCKGDQICHGGQCVNPRSMQVLPTKQVVTSEQVGKTPKFKDFPAGPVYTGLTAKLVLDNEFVKMYRTRLRVALTEKPVFAGEYVSETIRCGTCCATTTFVSKRTGKALKKSFGGAFGPYVTDTRVHSKLLIAEGPVIDKDSNLTSYATYYYTLKGNQMKLIKTIPTNPPPPCSSFPCPSCDYGNKGWDH